MSGLKPSTYFRRTAAISLASILSSAISASPKPFFRKLQTPAHRGVEHKVADARDESAHHTWVDDDLQRDVFARCLAQRALEACALVVVERHRRSHFRDGLLPFPRRKLNQ